MGGNSGGADSRRRRLESLLAEQRQKIAALTVEDWLEISKSLSASSRGASALGLPMDWDCDLCDFYDDLLKDRRVKAALKQAFGPKMKKVVEELLSEGCTDDGEAEEVIETVVREGGTEDEFHVSDGEMSSVCIMKFRNVYWVSGTEDPFIGYFSQLSHAQCVATEVCP